jgi:hypothetical protein
VTRPWRGQPALTSRCSRLLAMLFLAAAAAAAQQVGPYTAPADPLAESARSAAAAAAPHVAERYGAGALAELGPAALEAADRLAELRAWNEARRLPPQDGFTRPLPAPRRVDLDFDPASAPVAERDGGVLAQTTFSTVAWGGKVRVAGAARLRLHLARVELPAGARLWVHGAGRTVGPFGAELIAPDGGLWTPIVDGEELALDVEMPAAALAGGSGHGFTVDEALELVPAGAEPASGVEAKDTSCEVDASCYSSSDFPGYDAARHAVARLFFVDGNRAFNCTGQLLNDAASDGTPYLLTANHCISSQSSAASLMAVFDYYTTSCKGAPPTSAPPSANGSTLLVTGSQQSASDFSLLRLASLPSGRTFLGWNSTARAAADGTLLYRISQPGGGLQMYSVSRADSRSAFCTDALPLSRFIYSDLVLGAASPGSSGGAVMLASGQVVGQLYGGCGNSDNPCDPAEHAVDGSFAASFPQLKAFLAPGGSGGRCVPGGPVLCLVKKRFAVQVTWTNQFAGTAGVGHAIVGTDEAGYFYFTDPSNYELIVKILDFGTVFKVFYGELTNLQFTLTVSDSHTGLVKTYTNTPGDCGAIDESAFPASAATASGAAGAFALKAQESSCVPNGGTLCLLGRRFAVGVSWMNQFSGASGTGKAKPLSDLSGLFAFSDPSDVELVLKVVQFSDRIAFFYAALSDLAYDITVTDTAGGTVKTYHNPAGTFCGGLDNNAFPP